MYPKKNPNRRTFLKDTLIASGGLLSGMIPPIIPYVDSENPAKAIEPINTGSRKDAVSNYIALPKSGSIKGMGESFEADLFTGTERISIPVPASPGRDNFSPDLHLSYSISNGNDIFGMNWSIGIPSIQRKTQNLLPVYSDQDTFMLNGSELVLKEDSEFEIGSYKISTYYQRFENAFSRIEYWQKAGAPASALTNTNFWRVIDKNNITQIFGLNKIASTFDPNKPTHLFNWYLQLSYDGKGNIVFYDYFKDVPNAKNPEFNTRPYLHSVRYNNLEPIKFNDPAGFIPVLNSGMQRKSFFAELIFDYGEYEELEGRDRVLSQNVYNTQKALPVRTDPITSFRSGFGIRTNLVCQRMLMFHHQGDNNLPQLVKSMDLEYERLSHNGIQVLRSAINRGYAPAEKNQYQYSEDFVADSGKGVKSTFFDIACFPPLEFKYQQYSFPNDTHRNELSQNSGGKAPGSPISDSNFVMLDLFGRGLPDLLQTTDFEYYYWKNNGKGDFGERKSLSSAPKRIKFSDKQVGLGEINGDAGVDILLKRGNDFGFCEHQWNLTDNDGEITGWKNYEKFPYNVSDGSFRLNDPKTRFLDLTGDGKLDALVSKGNYFTFFKCEGKKGFKKVRDISRLVNGRDRFNGLQFDQPYIHFVDMTGDGLMDIVQILGQKVSYWPNLGYGYFGEEIIMEGTLGPASFFRDYQYLYFLDIDGSGPSDIIYVGNGQVSIWFNQSGQKWSERHEITSMPSRRPNGMVKITDLYGDGIMGILWSEGTGFSNASFLPLSTCKPGLMEEVHNNMGLHIHYQYVPSTHMQLDFENINDRSWIGRVPFSIYVLKKLERIDTVNRSRLVSKFNYAHGHYDESEKEFVGFGLVEQQDSETIENFSFDDFGQGNLSRSHFQHPILTKSWFHTGIQDVEEGVSKKFQDEYFQGDPAAFTPAGVELKKGSLSTSLTKPAAKAMKGSLIRKEIYGKDQHSSENIPYLVEDYQYRVVEKQAAENQSKGIYFSYESERMVHTYERIAKDPRVSHSLNLEVDPFGNVLESAAVFYPRRASQPVLSEEQHGTLIQYTKKKYAAKTNSPIGYRHSSLVEEKKYEISSVRPFDGKAFTHTSLNKMWSQTTEIPSESNFSGTGLHRKLIGGMQTIYWKDTMSGKLPFGAVDLLALPHTQNRIAFTGGLLQKVYGNQISPSMLSQAGYYFEAGYWWLPSGHRTAGEKYFDPNNFYLETKQTDPLGNEYQVAYEPLNLVVSSFRDPLGNTTLAQVDYRTLQTREMTDINGNRTEVGLDPLGLVIAKAFKGEEGESAGDTLAGLKEHLPKDEMQRHFQTPTVNASGLLRGASKRIVYDFWSNYKAANHPTSRAAGSRQDLPTRMHIMEREEHASNNSTGSTGRIKHTFQYLDGFNRQILTKVQASATQWVGTGYTVYNNKGKAVKQYEPFFSNTQNFELSPKGVSPAFHYDPLHRLVKTHFPDGSYSYISRTAWQEVKHDRNDTINDPLSIWGQKMQATNDPDRLRALQLTRQHANTPAVLHLDVKGRAYLLLEDNGADGKYTSQTIFDLNDKKLTILDDRREQVVANTYDLLSRPLAKNFKDKGEMRELPDTRDQIIYRWDARNWRTRIRYDALRRPTDTFVMKPGGQEIPVSQTVYGDTLPEAEAKARNLKGKKYQETTSAGLIEFGAYDFKGNLLTQHNRFISSKRGISRAALVNIRQINNQLEPAKYTLKYEYDALNRPVRVIYPDQTVAEKRFDQRGLVKSIRLKINDERSWSTYISNISYNPKGQKSYIAYANQTTSRFTYDPETFDLVRVHTVRGRDAKVLQDIHYLYDPMGNVLFTKDRALATLYYNQEKVEAKTEYTYDPLYRLTKVAGREHIGQAKGQIRSHKDIPVTSIPGVNDLTAMRNYTRNYSYDSLGNITQMKHTARDGSWTMDYQYEPGSNRLIAIKHGTKSYFGNGQYRYDANGNMVSLPHIQQLNWDEANRLAGISQANTGLTAAYYYDSRGNRMAKIVRRGQNTDHRLYNSGYEIFRSYQGSSLKTERLDLVLQLDDDTPLLIVEREAIQNEARQSRPAVHFRYQFSNHLKSSNVECDENGEIISYEEYYPFGLSSLLVQRGRSEVSKKRYRYLNKEKDDESGFYYFGQRYYIPWLGRWCSPDPAGIIDGFNLFAYVKNNPIKYIDRNGLKSVNICHDISISNPNEINRSEEPKQSTEPIPPQETDSGKPTIYTNDPPSSENAIENSVKETGQTYQDPTNSSVTSGNGNTSELKNKFVDLVLDKDFRSSAKDAWTIAKNLFNISIAQPAKLISLGGGGITPAHAAISAGKIITSALGISSVSENPVANYVATAAKVGNVALDVSAVAAGTAGLLTQASAVLGVGVLAYEGTSYLIEDTYWDGQLGVDLYEMREAFKGTERVYIPPSEIGFSISVGEGLMKEWGMTEEDVAEMNELRHWPGRWTTRPIPGN